MNRKLTLPQRVVGGAVGLLLALVGWHVDLVKRQYWWLLFTLLGGVGVWAGYSIHSGTGSPFHLYVLAIACGGIMTALAVLIAHQKWAAYGAMACGATLMAGALWLLTYQSAQLTAYNKAMVALDQHDLPALVKLLDESSAAFQAESKRSPLLQLLLPAPRKDIEARAHFHKGVALVQMKKGKEAVAEFWKSLRVNPGNRYIGLSSEEAALWYDDALQAKANIEKLYKSGQANGQAKGKGNPSQRPSEKRDPQDDPANSSGKKGRESL
jgi:tetratricopeptide (TPR) repeat protein